MRNFLKHFHKFIALTQKETKSIHLIAVISIFYIPQSLHVYSSYHENKQKNMLEDS